MTPLRDLVRIHWRNLRNWRLFFSGKKIRTAGSVLGQSRIARLAAINPPVDETIDFRLGNAEKQAYEARAERAGLRLSDGKHYSKGLLYDAQSDSSIV